MSEKFESDFLPVLPLRKQVLFPGAILPLFLLRRLELEALEIALARDKRVLLLCQKDPEVEEPRPGDLYEVGTVAEVLQVLPENEDCTKVLVEGTYTARTINYPPGDGGALCALMVRNPLTAREGKVVQAHVRTTRSRFEAFASLSGRLSGELVRSICALSDPLSFLHAVANHTTIKVEEKQQVLEMTNLEEKFILLNQALEAENQILELENSISGQVKHQINRTQREFYLNEQLKAIESELGINGEDDPELEELAQAVEHCGMPQEAREKAEKELTRLSRMAPLAPEAAITRTYLEWLTEVPWVESTEDRLDLEFARRVLDADHFGLTKVKERILEHLAVVRLVGQLRGPILCFVGPPGVGKTSLGTSIAKCMGRKFVRIALGGVRDEAEIRGHRRTYVGALPGKIIQSMRRAGMINPVMLLDEIDKMSSDFRGDPASALLEVLDPEQNRSFQDHYLEVDYDLSRVMFITTANTTSQIPAPLLDRMEIIRLPGYTEDEKRHIAMRHLLPRQRKEHGLRSTQLRLTRPALTQLINGYTREAGVRNLDRAIAGLCRKTAVEIVRDPSANPASVTPHRLREILGPAPHRDNVVDQAPEVGIVSGLAWTEVGGELLPVETTLMKGTGKVILTGKLGEVMQESAKTAMSYIRAHAESLRIDVEFASKTDVHVHLPEGAIPKDGPSAGITIAASVASALSGTPARQDIAMTGEMTLRGRVLKIGGLKEKALAALRHKIRTVIIPKDNLDDLEEIAPEIRAQLTFLPVARLSEVFDIVLVRAEQQNPVEMVKAPRKKKVVVVPRQQLS